MARNTAWLMAGQAFSVACQAVYFLCLGRLLGAVEYGIFAGVFAFTAIVAQYSSLGMGTVFLRYVACSPKEVRQYWGNVLLTTAVFGSIVTVALRFVGSEVLNPSSARLVVVSALANCICTQLTVECGRMFQCFGRMRTCAVLQLSANAIRAVTALVLLALIHHASAWLWSIYALAVSAVACSVSIAFVVWNFGWPCFRIRLFRDRAAEGLGYAFATSSSVIYNDLDKTLLSHFGLNLANGIYTMAYRVIDVATIPFSSLRDAMLPDLFREGQAGLNGAAGISLRVLKRVLPLAIVCSAGLIVAAPLMTVLLGPSFAESAAAIRWLCLIPALRSIHLITGSALTGAGYQRRRTAAQLSAAAFNLVLNLRLIPQFGWRGAAWASVITDATLALLCWTILVYTRPSRSDAMSRGVAVPDASANGSACPDCQ